MLDFEKLSAPFDPEQISWRVGSTNADKTKGLALAYIDARAVMDRLDQSVGPCSWQNRYTNAEGKTICEIGIKCTDEWIWKSDGAGDSEFEAEKGALSDAFKRAAVRWGIGRYLYHLTTIWVDIEQRGRSFVIAKHEYQKLNNLLLAKKDQIEVSAQENNQAKWKEIAANINAKLKEVTNIEELRSWRDTNNENITTIKNEISKNLGDWIENKYQTKKSELEND